MNVVFKPSFYEDEIFLTEGWHYRIEDKEAHLEYNEMKGAMSSPDSQLYQHIMNSLYPDLLTTIFTSMGN